MKPKVIEASKKFRKGNIYYNNIVCTTCMPIHKRINLRRIARKTLNVISNMGNKHAISFRFAKPTMTCSLYDTGSIIHCGGNSMIDKVGTVRKLIDRFQKHIPEVKKSCGEIDDDASDYGGCKKYPICGENGKIPIKVVNTMATMKVPFKINLMMLNNAYPMCASYFPENFTGCTMTLYYDEMSDRKITATIFTTGSINLCGCISAYEYRQYSNKIISIVQCFKE